MGLFADTLADATRPLPRATLRRMADASAPSCDEPEPQDEGEALTVYRLQKDGGKEPPAPPAPRAVDAAATAQGSLHAPVGDFDVDATLQFVTSIDGLETGKEQASLRTLGVTDEQEQLVSPDSLHRFHYAVATGSSVASNLAPSPLDHRGDLVSRIDSSDGMRRATGRGAPSGDPFPAAAPVAAASTAMPAAAAATPASPDAASAAIRQAMPGTHSANPAEAAHTAAVELATATTATVRADSPHAATGHAMPTAFQAPPMRSSTTDTAPRLSIGRIEVTVVSAPQPARAASRPAGDDAFLSRHYLRRL